jgi:hypothetical protein
MDFLNQIKSSYTFSLQGFPTQLDHDEIIQVLSLVKSSKWLETMLATNNDYLDE